LVIENDHGSYKNIIDEKEVMDITTKTKHCVVHFYHSDFRRCMIVDRHLEVPYIVTPAPETPRLNRLSKTAISSAILTCNVSIIC